MTSAKTRISKVSKASKDLAFALGVNRVALSDLHSRELEELIRTQLNKIDHRELRTFTELGELLARKGDEPLLVPENVHWDPSEFLNLKSHVIRAGIGIHSRQLTYRRHESDEVTTDRDKYHDWGRNGYIYSGKEKILLVHRLSSLTVSDKSLVEVTYWYTKVPNKIEYIVREIRPDRIPISGFCKHFGEKAPNMARELIWGLRNAYHQTAEALKHKAEKAQREFMEWDRLSGSIA